MLTKDATDLSPRDLPGLVIIAQNRALDYQSIIANLSPYARAIAEALVKGEQGKPQEVVHAARQVKSFANAR